MKLVIRLLYLLMVGMLFACSSDYYTDEGPPLPPEALQTDSIIDSQSFSISGERWLIYRYRIGTVGDITDRSDTLDFLENGVMNYNSFISSYNLYPSASIYILTLNETPWGMLSGALNAYALEQGDAPGIPFSIITPGSSNGQLYLWLRRI